jgi:23S rRNA pseudouridine1911/1915/1917 synthase
MATSTRGGRAARTRFRVVERFGDAAALLSVHIETGRTHQVRVHLASIGHPVAGDAAYGGARAKSLRDAKLRSILSAFPRPALHAHRLAFDHPSTGLRHEATAPLPEDMRRLLDELRSATRS